MVFMYFAFVMFVIAALFSNAFTVPQGTPWQGRIGFHFGWAGLACWVASIIFK
jgi:hypothetical protein